MYRTTIFSLNSLVTDVGDLNEFKVRFHFILEPAFQKFPKGYSVSTYSAFINGRPLPFSKTLRKTEVQISKLPSIHNWNTFSGEDSCRTVTNVLHIKHFETERFFQCDYFYSKTFKIFMSITFLREWQNEQPMELFQWNDDTQLAAEIFKRWQCSRTFQQGNFIWTCGIREESSALWKKFLLKICSCADWGSDIWCYHICAFCTKITRCFSSQISIGWWLVRFFYFKSGGWSHFRCKIWTSCGTLDHPITPSDMWPYGMTRHLTILALNLDVRRITVETHWWVATGFGHNELKK